jgi:transposase
MSRAIHADRSQQFLLPPSLDEWVAQEHPARFVRDVVETLDLEALGFRQSAGEDGRPHYAPEMLLGVWLFGWMERTRSSRALEKACLRDVAYLWLTGNHHPDHNTLWRFFRDNKKALQRVFRQTIRIAADSGLVGFALHAIDGTKLQCASSTDTAVHRKQLKEALKQLDSVVDKGMAEVEAREEQEDASYAMPVEMRDPEARKAAIRQALAMLEQNDADHLHPREPDARVLKLAGGTHRIGYNAQVAVDHDSDLIVSAEVTTDVTDNEMLVPMIQQILDNFGRVAETTVADKGYWSGAQLADAKARRFDVAVPPLEQVKGPYTKDKFTYDVPTNSYTCPRGERLPLATVHRTSEHFPVAVYGCKNTTCPARSECTTSKVGRIVKRTVFDDVLAKHAEAMKTPPNTIAIGLRKEIVEHAFGAIKANDGFRRFTAFGVDGAGAQWALVCTATNLRKLHAHHRAGRLKLTPRR